MSGSTALSRQNLPRLGLTGLALLFVLLALKGAIRAYTPVPFWDMWEGYLPFLDRAASGDWSVWWQQHNEHRILLARLFFWMDLRWFDGAGWFLIATNYVLIGLGAVMGCRILREVAVPAQRETDRHALTALAVMMMFFWCQWENLTWGFQSQFILAQLLPLAALYALYRSTVGDGSRTFVLACALGLLSAGTMANGILALPLMAAYAALARQGVRRTTALAVLTALMLLAYFHGYTPVAGHGSLSSALRDDPVQLVHYVLAYLGSPFHPVFGFGAAGRWMAEAAGLFFVVSSVRFAWQVLRQPRPPALPLAMLCFVAYIAGTAVGTAGGRLIFGVEQALSSRYTTPAIVAWLALLVLYAPALLALHGWRRRLAWGGFGALAMLMLQFQLTAQHSRADELFGRSVGGLAVEMRIRDMVEIGHIYPNTNLFAMSEQASDRQRSLFGLYPYRDVRKQMGTAFQPVALPACVGFVDLVETIQGDGRFVRVDGWLYEPVSKTTPQAVRFLDASGKQIGYALGGKTREDVARAVDREARPSGYRGYLSSTPPGTTVTLRGEGPAGPFCQQQVKPPSPPPFAFTAEPPSAPRATVSDAGVMAGNGWLGSDYAQSSFAGMRVYGSFVSSDADRGTIVLRIKRGDKLFYRSGPTAGQQTIDINGTWTAVMPLAVDWILLDFSSDALPEGPFTVKLSDNGAGWGEWSAIALVGNK